MLNASPQLSVIIATLNAQQDNCLVSDYLTVRQLATKLNPNTTITKAIMRRVQRMVNQLCPSEICTVYIPEKRDIHIKKYKFTICAR